jgi:hypothetical protein
MPGFRAALEPDEPGIGEILEVLFPGVEAVLLKARMTNGQSRA